MYVCLCNGITEQQIRQAVTEGAHDLSELRCRLGVAMNCGQCEASIKQIIAEYHFNQSQSE